MLKRLTLVCLALFAATIAQAGEVVPATIDVTNCILFNAQTAGTAHTTTDSGTPYARPISVRTMTRIAVEAEWTGITGTANGVFQIQHADVPTPSTNDWVSISGASVTITGATGAAVISLSDVADRWLRLTWTPNSVTGGAVSAWCNAKSM